MTLRRWLLAGAILATGCATSGISDREVARLPAEDRAQILTAQKSIEVAASSLAAARVARDDAKQFRKIAVGELSAAKSKLDAARGAVDLGKSGRDDRVLRDADRSEDRARSQLIAARAKMDYADQLLQLREAKVDEADANLTAAKADVEATKLQMVQRNNLDTKVDARRIEATRQDAQERLAETRARVAQLEGDVAQLKTAWDDRRRESTASRGAARPLRAPAQAPDVSMPGSRSGGPSRGDVNDTPGAPETPQSQQSQSGIAPNP